MRTVKVWAAWVFLAAMVAGTLFDALTNKAEPFHVLMLSWAALDISAVQLLIATLTKRQLDEDKG